MRQLCAGKVLDFFADDADATLVGGVEFQDTGAVQRGAEEGFCEGENCGGFACSWGSVEEHVRELWVEVRSGCVSRLGRLNAYVGGLQGALEDFGGVVLCGDIVQGLWSTGACQ